MTRCKKGQLLRLALNYRLLFQLTFTVNAVVTALKVTLIASVPDGALVGSGLTNHKKVVGSVDIGNAPLMLSVAVAFTRFAVLILTVVPLGIPLPLMSASRMGISR